MRVSNFLKNNMMTVNYVMSVISFYTPFKTLENQWFSNVFRGCRQTSGMKLVKKPCEIFLRRYKLVWKCLDIDCLSLGNVYRSLRRNGLIYLIPAGKNLSKVDNENTRLRQWMFCWIYSKINNKLNNLLLTVIDFSPKFHFYTLWKRQKTKGFQTFSGFYRNEILGYNGLNAFSRLI